MHILISFSSNDREIARGVDVALRLRLPHASCFLDERGLTGGVFWTAKLGKELARADIVLLLIGRKLGPWQELEYYEALALSRRPEFGGRPRIVPVMLTKSAAPGLAFLATLHQIFAPKPASPENLSAIERALRDAPTGEIIAPCGGSSLIKVCQQWPRPTPLSFSAERQKRRRFLIFWPIPPTA